MKTYDLYLAEQDGELVLVTAKRGETLPPFVVGSPALSIEANSEQEANDIMYAALQEKFGGAVKLDIL